MWLEKYWNKNSKNIEKLLEKFFTEFVGENIFILTHRNADPDAIASAIALHELLSNMKINTYIMLPEGMNEISKHILQELNFIEKHKYRILDLKRGENLLINIDTFIIVDTNNPEQLGEFAHFIATKPYILIDHHRPGKLCRNASISITDQSARSTSEIVAKIILTSGLSLCKEIATLLLTGILYDTRRFFYATRETFATVYNLISIFNADYSKAQSVLQHEMPIAERIARLKAAQRLIIRRIGDWIIGYSHVSAYESSCARAILDLGADVAFIISKHKKILRVVGRAKQSFVRNTGISLGRDLMPHLGELLGGVGGGHDTAAVAEGAAKYEFTYVVNIIHEILEKKILRISKQAL